MTGKADNINSAWHNTSTLNLTIMCLLPRVNFYDFQYNNSGTWESRLNQQIDVNENYEYRFIINISSDQGWDDIDYINITAWYDNGSESSSYNQTQGGNFNLFIQYENITGTPTVKFLWPNNEVSYTGWTENNVTDPTGVTGYTEAHNLTFSFIPSYQFRYAPGPDIGWNTTRTLIANNYSYSSLYNPWSWNFNISTIDQSEYCAWATDEFGVYAYSEIVSVGWPSLIGSPGENISATNITIITRSNGNYSLGVNLTNAIHDSYPTYNISNESIYLRGADRSNYGNFGVGTNKVYLYGSNSLYVNAETNGTNVTASDIEYRCYIPMGTHSGTYHSSIYYYLKTEE